MSSEKWHICDNCIDVIGSVMKSMRERWPSSSNRVKLRGDVMTHCRSITIGFAAESILRARHTEVKRGDPNPDLWAAQLIACKNRDECEGQLTSMSDDELFSLNTHSRMSHRQRRRPPGEFDIRFCERKLSPGLWWLRTRGMPSVADELRNCFAALSNAMGELDAAAKVILELHPERSVIQYAESLEVVFVIAEMRHRREWSPVVTRCRDALSTAVEQFGHASWALRGMPAQEVKQEEIPELSSEAMNRKRWAAKLDITARTLRNWISDGKLRFIEKAGTLRLCMLDVRSLKREKPMGKKAETKR